MLAAQNLLENAQPIKPDTANIGVNTMSVSTTTIGVNTLTQTPSMSSIASRQIVVAKSGHSLASADLLDDGTGSHGSGSTMVKIGLPYPSNLRVEKVSEMSLLIRWDPPTAAISLNQSLDFENLNNPQFDSNEQVVNVLNYNLYLNNELHSVINGNDECAAIIEDIDLNTVYEHFL